MRQASRIWAILGTFGVLAVIAFGLLTKDILQGTSTVMLGVFAISMIYIAWVLHHGRQTDYADQDEAPARVGPEHSFPSSWAPPLLALGCAMFAVGVEFTPVLLAIGGTLIVLTLFTWIVQRVDLARLQHAEYIPGHAVPSEAAAVPGQRPGPGPTGPTPNAAPGGDTEIGHDDA